MSDRATATTSKPGRKTNAHLSRVRALIAQAVTDDDWVQAFQVMPAIVLTSQDSRARVMACRLLCEYAFGKPVSAPEPVETAENDLDQWGGIPPDIVGADRLPYLVKVNRQRPRTDEPDESEPELTAPIDSVLPDPNAAPIREDSRKFAVSSSADPSSIVPPASAAQPNVQPAAPTRPRPRHQFNRSRLRPKKRTYIYPATAENPMPCTDD